MIMFVAMAMATCAEKTVPVEPGPPVVETGAAVVPGGVSCEKVPVDLDAPDPLVNHTALVTVEQYEAPEGQMVSVDFATTVTANEVGEAECSLSAYCDGTAVHVVFNELYTVSTAPSIFEVHESVSFQDPTCMEELRWSCDMATEVAHWGDRFGFVVIVWPTDGE